MSEDERMFQVKDDKNTYKIHFGFDWFSDPDDRRYVTCVIETERHEFYSGVAVRHPREQVNVKTGWKISLKRACEAMDWLCGERYYKYFWHEIRLQLRQEKTTESLKKALEKENGQNPN